MAQSAETQSVETLYEAMASARSAWLESNGEPTREIMFSAYERLSAAYYLAERGPKGIQPMGLQHLALWEIKRGLNPNYVAAAYESNGREASKMLEKVIAKAASGKDNPKVNGYTRAELTKMVENRMWLSVDVPTRMREILATNPRLREVYPMGEYQAQFKRGDKV